MPRARQQHQQTGQDGEGEKESPPTCPERPKPHRRTRLARVLDMVAFLSESRIGEPASPNA